MERELRVSNFFAILIGLFLLAQGTWGLLDPPPFQIFTTNVAHAVIHILLGIGGVVSAAKAISHKYNLFLGILLLAVGLLWFIPGIKAILISLLNINRPVAYLNISIGTVSLFMALALGAGKNIRQKV